MQFLRKEGFFEEEIIRHIPSIYDRRAERYGDSGESKVMYTATLRVTVLSGKISLFNTVLSKIKFLVDQGIFLQRGEHRDSIRFRFTKLNEIKPKMIKEATINARKAAEQFAVDSASTVGNICHALQGQFSIEDTPRPSIKKVIIVTKVRCPLEK